MMLIAPSLLSSDFTRLGIEVQAVEAAGADWIHVDVMDGHFVPNLTLGPPLIQSLKKVATRPLDVHLMIDAPEKSFRQYIAAGADYLTIHVESCGQIEKVLNEIRGAGVHPGITLRPRTPLTEILPYLHLVDLVLVMTVEPGFGGQSFMVEQVTKISELQKLKKQRTYQYLVEVDGGVNAQTLSHLQQADVLVAGSYIFGHQSYATAIQTLKQKL